MTFAGVALKNQLSCIWQDGEERKDLKPDFFVVKSNGTVDIVEFKLPSLKNKAIVGNENRETFSAELNSYISQVSVYAEYFDDSANRKWFEKKYGFSVYKPRKYLVIGRRADFSSDEWRRIKERYNNFEIYTYDDIVDTVVSFCIAFEVLLTASVVKRDSFPCPVPPLAGSDNSGIPGCLLPRQIQTRKACKARKHGVFVTT